MRKASQDGGDNTSITSGIESETKKPGAGILKSTRNSIKRKVQHFSDDTANEPLLHKTKELSEIEKQSAKLLLSKTKTDFGCQKGDDKDKLLADEKIAMPSISDVTGMHCGIIIALKKAEVKCPDTQSTLTTTIHNHMNTNVFGNMEGLKNAGVAKTQILVELDASKPTGYSPSPLIFTTAKIHTDGKMKQMEPVQVTPVPILSTIEGGVVKTETKMKESNEKPKSGEFIEINNKNATENQLNDNKNITVTPLTKQVASMSKLPEKREFDAMTQSIIGSAFNKQAQSRGYLISDNKAKNASTLKQVGPEQGNIKNTPAQLSDINKKPKEEISSTKNPQLTQGSNDSTVSKLSNSATKPIESTINSFKNIPILNKTDLTHKISSSSSTADKSNVDINKNVQSDSQTVTGEDKTGNNKEALKVVAPKPVNDVRKTKEELDKIHPSSISTSTTTPTITGERKTGNNKEALKAAASKPVNDVRKTREELGKMNPSSISTSTTSKEDQKSSDVKSPSNKEAQYNMKSLNTEKYARGNNISTVSKRTESSLSKAISPSNPLSSTKKTIDEPPSTFSSKTISKETSPLMKPRPKTTTSNKQFNVTKTVPSTISTLTDITSKIPQTTSTNSSSVSKIQYSTDSSKTTSSGPISNVKNTCMTEDKTINTELKGSNIGSANNQTASANTASTSKTTGNSVIKASATATLNNAATVVSSISKISTTASGTKIPSSNTPSTLKSVPKQSVSTKTLLSGIPIVSSSVKSSTANAVTSEKINAHTSPVNKSITSNTKPATLTSKVSATDSSSIAGSVLSSTVTPASTASTKSAAKNVSPSRDKAGEAVKDVKGSKA